MIQEITHPYLPSQMCKKFFFKFVLETITILIATNGENQTVEQAGFRKDFITFDHIHTIRQLIYKNRMCTTKLFTRPSLITPKLSIASNTYEEFI